VNNPHIRAMLAQLLSLMIPQEDDDGRGLVPGVSHKLKMSVHLFQFDFAILTLHYLQITIVVSFPRLQSLFILYCVNRTWE